MTNQCTPQILRETDIICVCVTIDRQTTNDAHSRQILPEDERLGLLKDLKIKWQMANEGYQKLTFTLDTPAKKTRKEKYEAELAQLEKDIELLSRKTVVIVDE